MKKTPREKALKKARKMFKKDREPVEFYIFSAILAMLAAKDQTVRDRYFRSLKAGFPVEFRMVEAYLIEKVLAEFPDGEPDLNHAVEEEAMAWSQDENARDDHLEHAMKYIGETADLDDEEDDGEEEPEFDPDAFGGMPN